MKIETRDSDIVTLLRQGFYVIPRFQRPYSWDKDNVQEFWDDAIKDKSSDYFIGAMVTYKEAQTTYGVVDGQQRLTTIIMFLCAIRNELSANSDKDLAEGIQALLQRRNLGNTDEYVLTTETSFPYLQEHILKFGEPEIDPKYRDEEDSLRGAYELISSLIEAEVKMIADARKTRKRTAVSNRLKELRDKILNLKVIFIQLENQDDAYLIFETINTRGKDLSVTDMIKNHLMRLTKSKKGQVDPIRIKWSTILDNIQTADDQLTLTMDGFFHHYWQSKYEYITVKKLFKDMKKKIQTSNVTKFVDEFVINSRFYRELFEPSTRKWNIEERPIRGALDAMNVFRVRQQVPMVLAVYREWRNKDITLAMAKRAILAIEKFHFMFNAVAQQRSSGGISSMYAAAAKRLCGAPTKDKKSKEIDDLIAKLRERVPTFDEFKAGFSQIRYSRTATKQKKLVQYILGKVHASLNTTHAIDFSRMTLEHLASENGVHGVSKDAVSALGNLIFVEETFNSDVLKNKPVAEKKRALLANGYPFDEVLQNSKSWTDTEISLRTDWLAEKAYNEIWKI